MIARSIRGRVTVVVASILATILCAPTSPVSAAARDVTATITSSGSFVTFRVTNRATDPVFCYAFPSRAGTDGRDLAFYPAYGRVAARSSASFVVRGPDGQYDVNWMCSRGDSSENNSEVWSSWATFRDTPFYYRELDPAPSVWHRVGRSVSVRLVANDLSANISASGNTLILKVANKSATSVKCSVMASRLGDEGGRGFASERKTIAAKSSGSVSAEGPNGSYRADWVCDNHGDERRIELKAIWSSEPAREQYPNFPYHQVGRSIDVTLPHGAATYINGINVGTPTNAKHKWGKCTVQDFAGGPYGRLIVDYTYGTHIVRTGMLNGWRDNGGGPKMGCAKSDEFVYWGNSKHQKFDNGSLYWVESMSRAKKFQETCLWQIRWPSTSITWSYSGDHRYLGNAHQAAVNWSKATGLSITRAPDGQTGNIVFEDYYDDDSLPYAYVTYPNSWRTRADDSTMSFHEPSTVTIRVNQYQMDRFWGEGIPTSRFDFARTSVLTHEIGHALGAAHTDDGCGLIATSIMNIGRKGQDFKAYRQSFNTPRPFDVTEIRQLYGLPT